MTTQPALPRPRWYAAAVVVAVVALAALGFGAVQADSDLADSILGFFTGFIGVLLLALVLWTEIGRQRLARLRDAAALAELEPLRAESATDRAAESSADAR